MHTTPSAVQTLASSVQTIIGPKVADPSFSGVLSHQEFLGAAARASLSGVVKEHPTALRDAPTSVGARTVPYRTPLLHTVLRSSSGELTAAHSTQSEPRQHHSSSSVQR